MEPISFTSKANDLAGTNQIGAVLAEVLPERTTVSLSGTLGAGKTHLVQAIAVACGIARENVTSPTFVLCQHYHGTKTIHHLDAYRVKDDDEFLELGVDELFASPGLTIVEWGERVKDCLPIDRIDLQIEIVDETSRDFVFRSDSERLARTMNQLQDRLGGGFA
ncbi:MAG: tRNA (adenosine(37)-N6)-threonylcarbamoyltransferase complex ATPase subunit type 1 TsaE [Planctomycetaceae bacterium]|jgi:tRNA threonylcarbamoyladenosine biosynthesis protein TsaE|nr:tRNA (adenosine(37)-N6)-threonylcarbamoyltransferase complex ATPase subunit type 1 TsaE [Planctomycetaceae bacterium]